MKRYAVLMELRPQGSLGVFDPISTLIAAPTPADAVALAAIRAANGGWDWNGIATIASKGE